MLSVCGNYNYLEFISNSKSGQFFFYSHDGKYMIKTQTKEENKFLKKILPHYYQYMTENPHSFVCRILGMHRVKMYHLRRKVHFVIMESVFDTPQEIHTIYDLKGSLVGRESSKEARTKGCVLKDKDLLNDGRKFHLGSKKEDFMKQIEKDAQFLASLNIMDYSLLIGVHDRNKRDISQLNTDIPLTTNITHSNTPFRRMMMKQYDEESISKHISKSKDSCESDNGNSTNKHAISDSQDDDKEKMNALSSRRRSISNEFSEDPQQALSLRRRSISNEFSEDENDEFDELDEYDYDCDEDDGDSEIGEIMNAEYIKLKGKINRIFDETELKDSSHGSNKRLEEIDALKMEGELVGRLFRSPDDILSISTSSQRIEKSCDKERQFTFGPGNCEKHPWTSRTDKGINSRSIDGRGNEIYYVGIIDILQQYNTHKKAEHFFKSFVADSKLISAVCSKAYANRFADFLDNNID
jgi:1-phosphatidylinositol-4-phosphate 5-kinase